MHLKYDMKIVFYKTYTIKSVSCKNCINTFHEENFTLQKEKFILLKDAIM